MKCDTAIEFSTTMAKQHILIVEDEPAIADTLTYALETEGFEVKWCATAHAAYAAMRAASPDVMILDVGLPDEGGFDVCRQVRQESNVPIIFLTARDADVDRIVGLELGADDYVVKPFSPREVSARVRAILRRSAGRADAVVPSARQAPLQIDDLKKSATLLGVPVDLSRYEFRLLQVLAEHPGQVYSRDQLMDLVWDSPEASFDRTVDTHIKTLRAKLREAQPDLDVIITHRGLGYALRDEWSA